MYEDTTIRAAVSAAAAAAAAAALADIAGSPLPNTCPSLRQAGSRACSRLQGEGMEGRERRGGERGAVSSSSSLSLSSELSCGCASRCMSQSTKVPRYQGSKVPSLFLNRILAFPVRARDIYTDTPAPPATTTWEVCTWANATRNTHHRDRTTHSTLNRLTAPCPCTALPLPFASASAARCSANASHQFTSNSLHLCSALFCFCFASLLSTSIQYIYTTISPNQARNHPRQPVLPPGMLQSHLRTPLFL